jgi:hypothetical protein
MLKGSMAQAGEFSVQKLVRPFRELRRYHPKPVLMRYE